MIRQPFCLLIGCFCLGIFTCEKIPLPFFIVFLLCCGMGTAALLNRKNKGLFDFCLCLVFFFLGAVFLKNSQLLPANHIKNYIYSGNDNFCTLKGVVASDPQIKNTCWLFVIDCRSIRCGRREDACCGKLAVRLSGPLIPPPAYAQELVIKGRLREAFSRGSPGYKNYLRVQGISGVFLARSSSGVLRPARHRGNLLKEAALYFKAGLRRLLRRRLQASSLGIVEAMLLGERSNIPRGLERAMIKTGTVHILVVSGFNVGIIAFALNFLLKAAGIPRRPRIIILLPALAVYTFLTGASTPVVRAALMAVLFFTAYFFKREPDIYHSCALSAAGILFSNPLQLFAVGTQLSFLSVMAIILLYPKINGLFRAEKIKCRPLKFCLDCFSVSLAAWLGVVLPLAAVFRVVSPLAPLVNLFIVPLATVLNLSAFAMVLVNFFSPALAKNFSVTCDLLVVLIVRINLFFAKVPGVYFSWGGA